MITAVTVAGTAIAFFPILRKSNETIALGYVGGRLLEAVFIIIGLVSILTLFTLRQEPVGAYEMVLAVYLITKGSNVSAIASEPTKVSVV